MALSKSLHLHKMCKFRLEKAFAINWYKVTLSVNSSWNYVKIWLNRSVVLNWSLGWMMNWDELLGWMQQCF